MVYPSICPPCQDDEHDECIGPQGWGLGECDCTDTYHRRDDDD